MELRHIRYFLAVAEELNFTKAAERLCIAQPPLSRQIKDLEEELGTSLFIRKNHGLKLTEEGEHFLSYARQVMSLLDKAKEELRGLDQGLQGLLRLDSVDGQGPHLMAQWLSGFHEKHPLVEFDLWKGNSDEVQQRVQKGLADMGVIMEPYNEVGFDSVKVYEEPWVAIMPADHPLAVKPGDSVSCEELSEYELIIPARDSRRSEIIGWFSKSGSTPKIIGRMAHVSNAYQLAANHVGISIYPASAAAMAKEKVAIKKIIEPEVTARYVLIKNAERELSPASQAFWEYILLRQSEER